jgi:hypothetical protein
MAIDPNISLGVRPIEIANPLAQYGQVAQIQNAQNQNALAQYQLGAAQRQEATQNALSEAYKSAYNPETGAIDNAMLMRGLAERGAGHLIPDVQTKMLATQEKQGSIKKTAVETTGLEFKQRLDKANKAISDIAALNSPQEAMASIDQHLTNGDIDQQKANMLKSQLAQAPSFNAWQKGMLTNILDAKDRLAQTAPKPVQVKRSDGSIIFLDENPNSPTFQKEILPAQAAGMTPFEKARVPILQQTANASTTSANAAAANAATARQRLQQETATGELTPQTLDFAAETYRQTGQMPITGMGKNAASLRTQILNRATELASGMPAAEAAATVAANKQDIGSRTKAVKDFSTGKQGQQVNAFNTAIDHLGTMDKLTDALQNNDIRAFNSLSNTVARQTGQPAPTDFNAAKQIVTAEVIKAVVASGGGVTERQEAERNFADANSPQQLKGIINTYKQLLGGQLNSLNLQYENTTGRKDFSTKLTPEAKNTVAKLRGENITTGALAPADQEAMNWANANPTDPRAAQIKQKLGR